MRRSKENSQNSRNLYIKSLVLERRDISNQKRKFGFFSQWVWNNWKKMKSLSHPFYQNTYQNTLKFTRNLQLRVKYLKKKIYIDEIRKNFLNRAKKTVKQKTKIFYSLKQSENFYAGKKNTSWTKIIKNKYP